MVVFTIFLCIHVSLLVFDKSAVVVTAVARQNQNWSEAVKLSEEHGGKFDDSVFLPYAMWLRDKGRFDEALEAFRKAGRRDLSGAMTSQLM